MQVSDHTLLVKTLLGVYTTNVKAFSMALRRNKLEHKLFLEAVEQL